ncbi:hypothetical protein K1T71_005850 [Dendrolimus kikuchii]|uniref:Uncharacterized protein n=1 Tax=Dendrolimus kikuchii TaxID=765133 RepID=A0ACC1D5J6_9NEOP|nr:hypothetical protein K1T71_005850 [Dendrolimus kikuchii]
MEAELADLRSELRSLQAELARPRAEAAPPAPPPNMEATMAANLDRLTLLMESRFAAMEERLRPAPTPSPAPHARPRSQPNSPSVLGIPAAEFPPLPSRRASTETAVVRSTPPPLACPAPPPPPAATEEGWTTVSRRRTRKGKTPSTSAAPVAPPAADAAESAKPRGTRGGRRRGRGQKAQEQSLQPPPPPPPSKKAEKPKPVGKRVPRLRPPKSAAVILTLQPGAADRGVTYANLFSKAKARIKLADLGIEGGLRLKRARTGARMLIVPGADSAPQADALAEQLRLNLYPEDVRVSRPEKTVCLRVSGLDDHVHEEDVAAAIARTTGCSVASIKASKVRPGPDGMGQTVVACPVAAAKKLLLPGTKLLVGWSSALVKALPRRAQRCYRCHEVGHVAAVCASEVDRSGTCYRCGQTGHLVTGPCTAKPHCSVCEAAGRPAGHQVGSKPCGANRPTRRKVQAANNAPDRTAAAADAPTAAGSGKEDNARG